MYICGCVCDLQVSCQSSSGTDDDTSCRDSVIRYNIVSKGAIEMQLTFSRLILCPTCQVLVYPADEELVENNTITFT